MSLRSLKEKTKTSSEELKKLVYQVVDSIYKIFEIRDPYTAIHQKRVANLSREIAKEMGLTNDQIEAIYIAAFIHDIGKIAVPIDILSKPTTLNEEEYNLIKRHPKVAYEILENIDSPWPILEIIIQHHERIDGSGYPSGKNDKEINTGAKIIGVADVVEAITAHRPYRPGFGINKALKEILKNKGKLFDPEVVDACMKVFKEKKFKF